MGPRTIALIALGVGGMASDSEAQEIRGQVIDRVTSSPVATAGVFLLGLDRHEVAVTIADSLGRFSLRVPEPGNYYISAQRFGYVTLETPLVEVPGDGTYTLDLEVTPEPLGLEGLIVTVHNEQLENWLKLRLGSHPSAAFGFRAFQGQRLEEAKRKSEDNTELLRWLFIPISHGRRVCFVAPIDGCGRLYINNRWTPNEHIESVDLEEITAVVTFIRPASLWLFTRDFDWTRRPRQ